MVVPVTNILLLSIEYIQGVKEAARNGQSVATLQEDEEIQVCG